MSEFEIQGRDNGEEEETELAENDTRVRRRRSPTEEKQIAYREDHRTGSRGGFQHRRYWPDKKALANQIYRSRVRRNIFRALWQYRPETAEDLDVPPVRRRKYRRGAVPLGTWVEQQLARRISSIGRKFFARPYCSEDHRSRFVAFLTQLTQEEGPHTRELARSFDAILRTPRRMSGWNKLALAFRQAYTQFLSRQPRTWLEAFFQDEPAWEGRLRAWIDSQLASEPSGPDREEHR